MAAELEGLRAKNQAMEEALAALIASQKRKTNPS